MQLLSVFATMAALATVNALPLEDAMPVENAAPLQKRFDQGGACTNGVVVYTLIGSVPGRTNPDVHAPESESTTPDQQAIANAAINAAGGGRTQPIRYPANQGGTSGYGESVNQGIINLQDTIMSYVNRCPNGRIVVLGYSQGAQVVTGALAGSRIRGPVDANLRIVAGAAFADPTFQDGFFPVDAGSGSNNGRDGIIPGNGAKYNSLNQRFGPRFRSYCQAGDQFCDNANPNGGGIHGNAQAHFRQAAINFITGVIRSS